MHDDPGSPSGRLVEASRSLRRPTRRAQRSDGRIVVQAWLASRGLIFAVALLLAVAEGRSVGRDGQQLGRPALREPGHERLPRSSPTAP